MSDENRNEIVNVDPAAPSGQQTAAPNPPAGGGATREHTLSPNAFKKIKDQARSQGERQALEKLAKQHGYRDVEAMNAALARRAQPAAPQRPSGAGGGGNNGGGNNRPRDPGGAPANMNPKAAQAWERERQKILAERDASSKKAQGYEKKFRAERKRAEDRETEYALREAAITQGIKDPSYAVRLLEKHVEGKTEEDLKNFDEEKFFAGLREPHPYLFGETVRPANTAPDTTRPGTPAAPTVVSGPNGPVFDARDKKVSKQEIEARLRKMGIVPHA